MKIGIVGAMPQEIDLLRETLAKEKETLIANRVYHEGALGAHEVVIVFSRWGKVASASTATTLIDRFGVELIIFTGVAGGVDPSIEVGDIVIADRLIQHDFDASASAMFPKYEIPLLGIAEFVVDQEFVAKAAEAAQQYVAEISLDPTLEKARLALCPKGARVRIGLIGSGDQFIASSYKIRELRNSIPDLLCIEMEGAAIAQVAHEHGIPCIVIRSISDRADNSAPTDFIHFVKDVASHYSHGIVTKLLEMI